jgi:hypothetical protein
MLILAAIQSEDQDTLISATDIRGERKTITERHLDGRSLTEALIDDLYTADRVFAVKKDDNNRIQNLFFAHQKHVELLLATRNVLLMDCTYRTNKYKLPLLHILSCTNLQPFFSAGFCSLSSETHADYHWAIANFLHKTGVQQPRVFISDQEEAMKMSARSLLPGVLELLCIWHINKNVQKKAQQVWRDADGTAKKEKQRVTEQRASFIQHGTQVR